MIASSLLANMRLLALASDSGGRDWYDLSRKIEAEIEKAGWELAEQNVYIFISDSEALVALPVIGPAREVPGPWKLFDWVATPIMRKPLVADTWSGVSEEACKHLGTLQMERPKLKRTFILQVERRLTPSLRLGVEAIYFE